MLKLVVILFCVQRGESRWLRSLIGECYRWTRGCDLWAFFKFLLIFVCTFKYGSFWILLMFLFTVFFRSQVKNMIQYLPTPHQMMAEEPEIQQQKKTAQQMLLELAHHRIQSSRSRPAPVALLQTPTAVCAPSCCRFETLGWATTQTRPSSSSTAVGHVPVSAPTTTLPSPTCC